MGGSSNSWFGVYDDANEQYNMFTSSPTYDNGKGFFMDLVASGSFIFNVEGNSYLAGFVNVNANQYYKGIHVENVQPNPHVNIDDMTHLPDPSNYNYNFQKIYYFYFFI